MTMLREATPRDAAALAEFGERAFRETFAAANSAADMELHCARNYGVAQQDAELRDPTLSTVLMEQDGDIVGYLQLRLDVSENVECSPEILRLYVDARAHGTGVAAQLMSDAIGRAAQSGATAITLGVWEHNPRAIAFYHKWGFVECGEHTFMLGTDEQRDLVLRRRVP